MVQENKNRDSGFKIHNILLVESSFTRIPNVVFEDENVKTDINIENEISIENEKNLVSVIQNVSFTSIFHEEKQVSINIKMVGVFEKVGESPLTLEEFGNVNGVAIIFPYIREHLSNLSMKSGIGNIILPPTNFTKNKKDNE